MPEDLKILHSFTVIISGYGATPDEAFEDATQEFNNDPGAYSAYITNPNDIKD